jgi:hypothetical protein
LVEKLVTSKEHNGLINDWFEGWKVGCTIGSFDGSKVGSQLVA